jgi:isoamylase
VAILEPTASATSEEKNNSGDMRSQQIGTNPTQSTFGKVEVLKSTPQVSAQDATAADTVEPGKSFPLGASLGAGGANFSVFSKHATAVELLLFNRANDPHPSRVIDLDPRTQRTYHYWHTFVPGLEAGQLYGYRAYGPFAPDKGLRFDGDKVLLDPYAKCIARPCRTSRAAARSPGGNTATALKGVLVDADAYDWEDDRPPRTPFAKTVIYEVHVGNFTCHPNSGVEAGRRGTFAGLINKLPYLQDLGVTAIELLPVFAFDDETAPEGRRNVWGYQPLSFFAPEPSYSSRQDPLGVLDEFRDMVKAVHRAGIEVILDVVYNHTAEGGADGATVSLRGFANETYYILDEHNGAYADYSGTGNSLNANESVVRRLILDSLRYWVNEMHVDGFRFDLAAVLSRDERGRPIASPPVLLDIQSDPVLASVKLIAEAWDAAGLYQVGDFVGDAWKEWNGKFRDDVRRFLKGDRQTVRSFASRLLGSPDIYGAQDREPEQSVNFVTCHDGFTLNDLVSYNLKHNEENGEWNRDGSNENHSWNCGVEGPTQDLEIERLRNRQVKNFLVVTMLATGTPMLLMGDEVRRTQRGNNNAYCLDDETTWLDWSGIAQHADIYRFVRRLIELRNSRTLAPDYFNMTLNELISRHRVEWHGVTLGEPDWGDGSHSIAGTMHFDGDSLAVHFMVNAYWEPLEFAVPPLDENHLPWRLTIDTFRAPPADISVWSEAEIVQGETVIVQPRSIVVLRTKFKDVQEE